MNYSRRNFLSSIGAAGGVLAISPALKVNASYDLMAHGLDAVSGLDGDAFWMKIRNAFDLPAGVINLDNGYCNPLTRETMADLVGRARYVEQLPARRLE